MAQNRDIPSRRQIKQRIDISKKKMKGKETDIEKTVSDVESVRKIVEKLDFGGTAEGTLKLETSLDKTENVTISVFDKQNNELEHIQHKGKNYETDIEKRETRNESDLKKISDTSSKIETKETINALIEAKEAVLRDIDFLSEQLKRAKDARDESDAAQRRLEARVNHGKGTSQ